MKSNLESIWILKNKSFQAALPRNAHDEESVNIGRALDSFRELFEKVIPIEVFGMLKRKVETLQVKEDSQVNSVDVDKFLEYSASIYQRFHLNY